MLVGTLVTMLTLAVLQLGLAIYVRNVVQDAAVEGAFHGALIDVTPGEGAERTREIIARTIGSEYASDVSVSQSREWGYPTIDVTVRARLPLVGLLGPDRALEVSARAPLETAE